LKFCSCTKQLRELLLCVFAVKFGKDKNKQKLLIRSFFNYYYDYYYYCYLTAIGLTPGGSSIHLHTNSTQNIEDGRPITITKKKQLQEKKLGNKLGSVGRSPSLRVVPWHVPYN
jgi:hypothetical protein